MLLMLGDSRICILAARRLPPPLLLLLVPPHRIRRASGAATAGCGGAQKGHADAAPPAGSGIGATEPTPPLPTQLPIPPGRVLDGPAGPGSRSLGRIGRARTRGEGGGFDLGLSVAGELACRIGDEARGGSEEEEEGFDPTATGRVGSGRSPVPWLVGLVGSNSKPDVLGW
jgi:hypothetical protein